MMQDEWARDGISVLRSALSPAQVEEVRAAVDTMYGRFLSGAISNYSIGNESATTMPDLWVRFLSAPRERQSYRRWNVVDDGDVFRSLVDHPSIFPTVLERMGPDIQLHKSQIIVVPPGVQESAYLHADSGSMAKMCVSPGSELPMVSVQVFLTDLEHDDMGNFTYVPGSHHTRFPYDPENPTGSQTLGYVQGRAIEGRVQLRVRAGDAVLFPHSLWHGISDNKGQSARKSLIYSYSKIYIRPYDYEKQSDRVLGQCTPRQRRLLGDFGGWYWRPGCMYHPAPDQADAVG